MVIPGGISFSRKRLLLEDRNICGFPHGSRGICRPPYFRRGGLRETVVYILRHRRVFRRLVRRVMSLFLFRCLYASLGSVPG